MESIPFVTPVGLVEGDAVINVLKGDADTNGSKDFIAFYADGFDRAARLAFLLTGDVSVSEDIAQEALSRLQPRFATIEFPSAYLRTVVVNLSSRSRLSRGRERATREHLGLPEAQSPQARELLNVIDALPRRQKTALVLRYWAHGEDQTSSHPAIGSRLRRRPRSRVLRVLTSGARDRRDHS